MKLLLKNGWLVDPAAEINRIMDILVEDGKITAVAENIEDNNAKILNVEGLTVTPGLIDMHVHFREPGFTGKETIQTGCQAALKGGFTTVACMPNTEPVADNASVFSLIREKAAKTDCNVVCIGAITKKSEGQELAKMQEMIDSGAVAFSDDGNSVMNARVMHLAMQYSKLYDVPLILHCEDTDLSKDGLMNEGETSARLGLKGITDLAETVMVGRDLLLAEKNKSRIHIAHVSTAGSVEMVRQAKSKGVRVTAEAAPHHFTLTDSDIGNYDTNCKVNPPLRSSIDRDAVIEGLKNGTIDCIACDHAPHTYDEKNGEFALAPNGISGLETSLSLALSRLVQPGHLDMAELVRKMSLNPARILGLKKGSLQVGMDADITIFAPDEKYSVQVKNFVSKGKNSPFDGWDLSGVVKYTITGGKIAYQAANN